MFREIVLILNAILFIVFSFFFIKEGVGNLQYWWEYFLSVMVIVVPVLNIIALMKKGIEIPKRIKENQFALGIAIVLILGLTIFGYSYYTDYVREKMLAFKNCVEECECPSPLVFGIPVLACSDINCQMQCEEKHGITYFEFNKWMLQH